MTISKSYGMIELTKVNIDQLMADYPGIKPLVVKNQTQTAYINYSLLLLGVITIGIAYYYYQTTKHKKHDDQ